MQYLDGILYGDDVHLLVGVDVIYDRRQGGGLARAGRAGDQYQPAPFLGETSQHRRQAQLLEGGNGGGEHPSYRDTHRAPLFEDIGAKPSQARYAVGEIHLVVFRELLGLFLVHQGIGRLHRIRRRQPGKVRLEQLAVNPEVGRSSRLDMEVGGLLFNHELEKTLDVHDPPSLASRYIAVDISCHDNNYITWRWNHC